MLETFAGGGDAPEVANFFTATDLVAVSLLSVDVPGTAALRILGTNAEDLTGLRQRWRDRARLAGGRFVACRA
jgi:Family of unknown function (DUF6308)